MSEVGRNDPCPCGSGRKYKKCHMGRMDILSFEAAQREVGTKIAALGEVDYGRCQEMARALDIPELTGQDMALRFVDLNAYLDLVMSEDKKKLRPDLQQVGAGMMVNRYKTMAIDPRHITIAITPAVDDSTLIHEIAHVLDLLGGSQIMPGAFKPLAESTNIPLEHLDHTMEFGRWLCYLRDRFDVPLDADDAIVAFLYEGGMLLRAEEVLRAEAEPLVARSREMLDYLSHHREEVVALIRSRKGYLSHLSEEGRVGPKGPVQ